jgi:hypothetical protein
MKKLNYSVTVLALSIFVLFGCGSDDKKEAKNPTEMPAITDINELANAPDKRSQVGRKVEVESARVQQVVGNYVFWAGEGQPGIPVVRQDKIRGPVTEHVSRGGRVRMNGTVRLLESVAATDPLWDKISESEKQAMKNAVVYVDAEKVMVVQPGIIDPTDEYYEN